MAEKDNQKKPSGSGKSQRVQIKSGTQKYNILRHMRDGNSLNRFEAFDLGCSCLNSFISATSDGHGFEFPRKLEKVPNRFGSETSVMRYWLSGDDSELVDSLLESVI
jgi:hypothetical protein